MAKATVSPLIWPAGQDRTTSPIAERHRIRVHTGVTAVLKSIDLLGAVTSSSASDIVLSFENSANRRSVVDGGAALWFVWDAAQCCVACDMYAAPSANLFAIAQIICGCVSEHGRGSVAAVRHALAGYTPRALALLATKAQGHWSQTLGVSHVASSSEIRTAFRRRALDVHPDMGGSRVDWDSLMDALKQAGRESAPHRFVPQQWELVDAGGDAVIWAGLFPDLTSEDYPTNRFGDLKDLPTRMHDVP